MNESTKTRTFELHPLYFYVNRDAADEAAEIEREAAHLFLCSLPAPIRGAVEGTGGVEVRWTLDYGPMRPPIKWVPGAPVPRDVDRFVVMARSVARFGVLEYVDNRDIDIKPAVVDR